MPVIKDRRDLTRAQIEALVERGARVPISEVTYTWSEAMVADAKAKASQRAQDEAQKAKKKTR